MKTREKKGLISMDENFYNNPLKIIWKARNSLMPFYLFIIWFVLLLTSFMSTTYFNFMDFSSFQIGTYFSISSTGLTLTLALFVAGKNAFSEDDLKILAKHINDQGVKGQPLIEFLAPYVFTSILFLITGLLSLFAPYFTLEISREYKEIIKLIYINILSLGFFSLFYLIINILNDVFIYAFSG